MIAKGQKWHDKIGTYFEVVSDHPDKYGRWLVRQPYGVFLAYEYQFELHWVLAETISDIYAQANSLRAQAAELTKNAYKLELEAVQQDAKALGFEIGMEVEYPAWTTGGQWLTGVISEMFMACGVVECRLADGKARPLRPLVMLRHPTIDESHGRKL